MTNNDTVEIRSKLEKWRELFSPGAILLNTKKQSLMTRNHEETNMALSFQGKTALVTGGNKGIGFAICRSLAEQGITVLLGARDEQKGSEAVSKLQLAGLDVRFVRLDIIDEVSINNAAEFIDRQYGKLDILINNAAINLEFSAGRPVPSKIPLETF